MNEYFPLLVYLVISAVLSLLILSLSFVFSTQKADPEKISAYERRFDPCNKTRARFDVRFYLVVTLFIIFEVASILDAPSLCAGKKPEKKMEYLASIPEDSGIGSFMKYLSFAAFMTVVLIRICSKD